MDAEKAEWCPIQGYGGGEGGDWWGGKGCGDGMVLAGGQGARVSYCTDRR